MTVSCLSCAACQTADEYCKQNPDFNGCPPTHNCLTKEVWSEDKKKWCCENEQLGCPPTEPPTHNCLTKEMWTEDKKKWCCENEQLGCPPTEPPTHNCLTKEMWSEDKK